MLGKCDFSNAFCIFMILRIYVEKCVQILTEGVYVKMNIVFVYFALILEVSPHFRLNVLVRVSQR